jgi:hypothetical protein
MMIISSFSSILCLCDIDWEKVTGMVSAATMELEILDFGHRAAYAYD